MLYEVPDVQKSFGSNGCLLKLSHMHHRSLLWLIVICLLFSCTTSKWPQSGEREGFKPLVSLIEVYQERLDHLSAVRASECPMWPSCLEYSKQAFKKHGFFIGWTMTCDRLMRCGRDEMKLAPLVKVKEKWKYYDPIESNDFWWVKKQYDSSGFLSPLSQYEASRRRFCRGIEK